jgi:nucleoid DNA-binding protein
MLPLEVPQTLSRQCLATAVHRKTGVELRAARAIVGQFVQIISDELVAGHSVKLTNFGSLEPVRREGRKGRNVGAALPVVIPPYTSIRFRPSKRIWP